MAPTPPARHLRDECVSSPKPSQQHRAASHLWLVIYVVADRLASWLALTWRFRHLVDDAWRRGRILRRLPVSRANAVGPFVGLLVTHDCWRTCGRAVACVGESPLHSTRQPKT